MTRTIIKLPTPSVIQIQNHPSHPVREITLTQVMPSFQVDSARQEIRAHLHPIPKQVTLYKGEDFADHAADTQGQHEARLLEVLGEDIPTALQSIASGTFVVAEPTQSPLYLAAAAAFDALPAGTKVLLEPVSAAVAKALKAGDTEAAKSIISTLPNIYEGAEEEKQVILSLFDE